MEELRKKHALLAVSIALVALTLMPYAQVRHFDFVNYDDDAYLTHNPHLEGGISARTVAWAFTSVYAANWHPITWISHLLDISLFGLAPGPHHVMALLFHCANTVIMFVFLHTLTGALWKPTVVAALFALHPMHVESVAWASERKDLLCAMFSLLASWSYVRWVRSREPKRFAALLCFFAAALLSKPMAVTLPFVLLLLDYWPLGRAGLPGRQSVAKIAVRYGERLREKWPLLLMTVASCCITYWVQQRGGSVRPLDALSLGTRFTNGIGAYGAYLMKLVAPHDMAFLYPHPSRIVWLPFLASSAALIALTYLALKLARAMPAVLLGWLWYLGTLVPAIGFVQVGWQAMADRYTYLTYTGLFIAITWGAEELTAPFAKRKALIRSAAATAVLAAFTAATARQAGSWKNSLVLFEHALAVTKDNYVAENNLGGTLEHAGRLDEAIEHYRRAMQMNPAYASPHENLGNVYTARDNLDAAAFQYREALRLVPSFADAHNNYAVTLLRLRQYDSAVVHFKEALRLSPRHVKALNNLGSTYEKMGREGEALALYREAARIDPDNFDAQRNLGVLLAQRGHLLEAVEHLRAAVRSKPDDAGSHNNLGLALVAQGRYAEALEQFGESQKINPKNAETEINLGYYYAKQDNMIEAIPHFKAALVIDPKSEDAKRNLLMAQRLMEQGKQR